MSQMSKVSIIIPVYNVEKYIDECFVSVVGQAHESIEVIIVDDGSTDSSPMICDSYAARDNRFFVVHTRNRGIAAARNLAMEFMSGEYCFFLDPDDVLEHDSISYLVNLIERTESDMALAVTRQFRNEYVPAEPAPVTENVYFSLKAIIEDVLFDKGDVKPIRIKNEIPKIAYEFFSVLYKTNKLATNDIHFIPVSYGEDTYVCFKSLLTSQKVVTSSKIVYSHRRNPTSTTFQYHPNFLKETYVYYKYYLELFEKYAPDYIPRAEEGLDGQYLYRCLSAIEGELYFSPIDKPVIDKIKTVRQIRNDEKFKKLFTFESMKYTSDGMYRKILIGIKLGLYPVIVCAISAARKQKRRQ